jgi:mono/diheme cytochrome c family protein
MSPFTQVYARIIATSCWMGWLALTPAWSVSPPDPQDQEPRAASKLFGRHCAKCHGKEGRAKSLHGRLLGARNLTGAEWQGRVTDDQIRIAIEKGPGAMPSFAKKLSQEERETLVECVRHFNRDRRDFPARER